MTKFGRKRRMCEWMDLAAEDLSMRDVIERERGHHLPPFHLLSVPGMGAQDQRTCAELWARERRTDALAARRKLAFTFPPSGRRKIRLGYLSNDFYRHATAHLLIEVLEAHDRDDFDIYAYSFGLDDGSPMRRRLVQACDRFIDIMELTDTEAARAIHSDAVDILIDLKGFTAKARTGTILLRPAPPNRELSGVPRNDARRLVFTANLGQREHLGRLQLADLVLDTAPFNAHTTASDALWAGVPLVTCPGETFPSRVAGSILRAAGLSELVADSREAYFDLAYGIATENDRLAEIRTRVAVNRLSSPLFDVATYTSDLEGLFRLMLWRYRAELPPAPIGAGQQPEPGRGSPDPLAFVSPSGKERCGRRT